MPPVAPGPPAPPAPPVPPPPAPHAVARPRERVAANWGPFQVIPVRKNTDAGKIIIGWSVKCWRHEDGDGKICKKDLSGDTPENRIRLLEWLIRGAPIPDTHPTGKTEHCKIGPRDLPLRPEADIVADRIRIFGS